MQLAPPPSACPQLGLHSLNALWDSQCLIKASLITFLQHHSQCLNGHYRGYSPPPIIQALSLCISFWAILLGRRMAVFYTIPHLFTWKENPTILSGAQVQVNKHRSLALVCHTVIFPLCWGGWEATCHLEPTGGLYRSLRHMVYHCSKWCFLD